MKISLPNGMVCVILGAASLVGVLLVLWGTGRYGIGTSPDAVAYLSTAQNVAEGRGFIRYDGSYYLSWPPLFPILLAATGKSVGGDVSGIARYMNAGVFGFIIFCSGLLFLQRFRSNILFILAILSVVLSVPLLGVSVMAWSEPLYTLFSLLFFLALARVRVQRSLRWLLLCTAFATLACLQRYIGMTLLVTGVCALLFSDIHSMRERVRCALLFSALAGIPLLVWIARNYFITGRLTGVRFPAFYGVLKNVSLTLTTLGGWFFPASCSIAVWVTGVILLLVLLTVCIVAARTQVKGESVAARNELLILLVVYSVIYCVFLIVSSSLVAYEPIGDRLLAPLYPLILFLMFSMCDNFSYRLSRVMDAGWVPLLTAVILTIWLLYPLQRTVDTLSRWRDEGVGENFYGESYYGKKAWQESPLIRWLQHHHLSGEVYTNEPDALYMLTGVVAKFGPVRIDPLPSVDIGIKGGGEHFLVWFEDMLNGRKRFLHRRSWIDPLKSVAEKWLLERVATFPDGGVYRIGVAS